MTTLTGSPAVPLNEASEQEMQDAVTLVVAKERFRLLDRDALDRLPPPNLLVEGVLPKAGLACLVGSRGLGKTLLAMSLAGATSTDLPTWMGRDVLQRGPVLYVSLEGFHGIPNRLRAWEGWANRRAENIIWLPDPVDLKRHADARQVGLLARDLGAVAVFVDSARASGAGAEDTKDMGAYVKGLETVQNVQGGLVVVLHNTGWDETRERGSTLLPDACDTSLILTGDPNGVRTLAHRKFRDGEWMDPLHFAFHPVPGTGSGVLLPADPGSHGPTLADRLAAAVKADPGHGTATYVRAVEAERTQVSKTLAALAAAGDIQNLGTKQNPSWNPKNTQPALEQP